MSTDQELRAGFMVGITLRVMLLAGIISVQGMVVGTAGAFTTERPSSVLIFPKVVNTNPDTIIQITNAGQMMTHAVCFYTDGRTVGGEPVWQVTDFALTLTRQQPTHWSVGEGRAVNPQDEVGGLDPGLIPPVAEGFTGFLVCVEVLADGTPVSANSLKGEATIGDITFPGGVNAVSKYNAIGIQACNSSAGPCGMTGAAQRRRQRTQPRQRRVRGMSRWFVPELHRRGRREPGSRGPWGSRVDRQHESEPRSLRIRLREYSARVDQGRLRPDPQRVRGKTLRPHQRRLLVLRATWWSPALPRRRSVVCTLPSAKPSCARWLAAVNCRCSAWPTCSIRRPTGRPTQRRRISPSAPSRWRRPCAGR